MKLNILSISTVLVAAAALVTVPAGAIATGGSIITIIGILSVFVTDYGRVIKPCRKPARAIVAGANKRMSDAIGGQSAIRLSHAGSC